MIRDEGGYTLAELVVVLAVFAIVLTLTTLTFNRIVTNSSHLVKGGETQIEGMIGLELLRIDLENAGFGLPWSYQTVGWGGYAEAAAGDNHADDFNETVDGSGSFMAPRAVLVRSGEGKPGVAGADSLVIKASSVGINRVSRKWSYLTYSSNNNVVVKPSRAENELVQDNAKGGEVIALRDSVKGGMISRELVMDGAGFSFGFTKTIPQAYRPATPQERLVVYGVDDSTGVELQRPFNRADYYVVPDSPRARCAQHTGTLVKRVLNQKDTDFTEYPLLDCVADFQVIVGLDTNHDGDVDLHTDSILKESEGWDARTVREQVKEVRVYVLAQEGAKDSSYLYPVPDESRAVVVGDLEYASDFTRVWTAAQMADAYGSQWRHYRWKLFRIVVQPKNLQ